MSNKKSKKSSTASSPMFNASTLSSAAHFAKNKEPNEIKAVAVKEAKETDADKKHLNPSELQGLAKVKWSSMQTDLKSALGSWSELDQSAAAKSPEEEQLDKVKSLIEDLKLKLNDF